MFNGVFTLGLPGVSRDIRLRALYVESENETVKCQEKQDGAKKVK